ncbi:MAG: ABC transporter permease subunit [Eubacteriales bacterium]
MKGYTAFLGKEFMEQWRTYKILIMLVAFTLFGMMSPLLAKIMPDIFASIDMEGMSIKIPEPTYIDAYSQFFKNTTQMGIVVLILVFSGIMSQELSKGTLVNILSKGMPRATVVLSKYTAGLMLWTVSLIVAAAVNYGYTVYLFGSHPTAYLLITLICLWLFGAFLLAVAIFTGTLTKGGYGGLLATAAVLGILLLLGIIPKSTYWNPVSLVSISTGLMDGSMAVTDILAALWITPSALVLCIAGAIAAFQKKQM